MTLYACCIVLLASSLAPVQSALLADDSLSHRFVRRTEPPASNPQGPNVAEAEKPPLEKYENMLRKPEIEHHLPRLPKAYDLKVQRNTPDPEDYDLHADTFAWANKRHASHPSPVKEPKTYYAVDVTRKHGDGGDESYTNAFAFHQDKAHITCSQNHKGKRDERGCTFTSSDGSREEHQCEKSRDGEQSAKRCGPIRFSEILWQSYQAALYRAGYHDMTHEKWGPGPPLRSILRRRIAKPPAVDVLDAVWRDGKGFIEKPDAMPGHDEGPEKIWPYPSPVANRILGETPHGKGILRFLTDHAGSLGRLKITAVGLKFRPKEGEVYDIKVTLEPLEKATDQDAEAIKAHHQKLSDHSLLLTYRDALG